MPAKKHAGHEVAICQRTGFKIKASELGEEWTGLLVRRASIDPRHPSLDRPPLKGETVRDDATGPGSDNDLGDSLDDVPALSDLGASN